MHLFKQNILLLALLLICSNLNAQLQGQQRIDSLLKVLPDANDDTNKVNLLNELSALNRTINRAAALSYAEQAIESATKLDWKKGVAIAYRMAGNSYYGNADFPSALMNWEKSLNISREIGYKQGIAYVTLNIGSIYLTQKNYPKAMAHYQEALTIAKGIGDKKCQALANEGFGNVYDGTGNTEKAIHYFNSALKMNEELGNKEAIAKEYNNIADVYLKEKHNSKALEYYSRALQLYKETGSELDYAENIARVGEVYMGMHSESPQQELLTKAIANFEKCLQIGLDKKANELQSIAYGNLANAYAEQGNFKKALEYTNMYREVVVAIRARNNMQETVQMQLKEDHERKIAEEKKNAAIKLFRQQAYTGMGIAGILLLTGFSFFIVKERKKTDKLLLNILPSEVAAELKANGSTKAKYFDNVTVLFTDFVNFTTAGDSMQPQELLDELDTCFKAFDEITDRHNIEKIKTIGDSYLAVAGLPAPDLHHANNVVKAAIEINAFMKERYTRLGDKSFEIRTGIHSGSVVAGIVGVRKFAYDIWGDTVNTAARMEQNSQPGKINVSQSTYELVKNEFHFTYRGEIDVKGKGMMKMYFVD